MLGGDGEVLAALSLQRGLGVRWALSPPLCAMVALSLALLVTGDRCL